MPQFRFRSQDKEGKVRAGRLSAVSKAEAHQRIEQTGMKVLELTELLEAGPPALQVQGSAGKVAAGYKAARAEPYDLRESWLEKVGRVLPSGQAAFSFFGVVAVVGVILAALTWKSGSSKSKVAEVPKYIVNVTLKGQAHMPGVQDFGDMQVVLDFPEVPYQVSKKWSELEHPSAGRFKWKVDFISSVSPKTCVVRAHKPHYAPASSPVYNLKNDDNAPQTGRIGNFEKIALELEKEAPKPVQAPPQPVPSASPR